MKTPSIKLRKTSAMLKEDKERMRSLVTETLTLLCKNGLSFNKQFTLNALIGINLDSDKEFHFIVSETFSNTPDEKSSTKVAKSGSGDSSEDSQSSSESDTDDDDDDDSEMRTQNKNLVKSTTISKMQAEAMLDLECQSPDDVHVKTEPLWDRSKNAERSSMMEHNVDHSNLGVQMGHWRVMENQNENLSKPKVPKFIPLVDHNDICSTTWQQFAALIPDSENNQEILDESWQQQSFTDDIFPATNDNYLEAYSLDYSSFGTPGKYKRGRMKMPNTDERIGRKILRCRGSVITVSKAQHVFNYGCRPTFQRIKEVMIILEQQGFGHMRMMEFEGKKTKIRHAAVKAMSFVKKPMEEVVNLLPMYDISSEDYVSLYQGATAVSVSDSPQLI